MPSPVPSLSVFIIAQNEADRIGATIAAVRGLTDDLVVVDSGSTDGTRELAASLGARVIEQPWLGYGPQKRFAEAACRHDWVFNLDADEVPDAQMIAAVRELFAGTPPPPGGYETRIVEVFPGEPAPHPLAYGISPVRLYHRAAGSYSTSPVHDRVEMARGMPVRRLAGAIAHYSVRSLGDQISKLNAYSDAQADDMIARGDGVSRLRLGLEFPANFIKAYLGRRHFLRGTYGLMTAMNYAFFRYLRAAKYWERRLEQQRRRKP